MHIRVFCVFAYVCMRISDCVYFRTDYLYVIVGFDLAMTYVLIAKRVGMKVPLSISILLNPFTFNKSLITEIRMSARKNGIPSNPILPMRRFPHGNTIWPCIVIPAHLHMDHRPKQDERNSASSRAIPVFRT